MNSTKICSLEFSKIRASKRLIRAEFSGVVTAKCRRQVKLRCRIRLSAEGLLAESHITGESTDPPSRRPMALMTLTIFSVDFDWRK
jgi:hypothetical protein